MSPEATPTKKKRQLKVFKKLPKVQVGTILNIFWTNGSYEKPSNPLTREEIDKNFIEIAVKIDWSEEGTGVVTLRGKFNYLIYKGGEYYFLTPIRVIDIKKQEFVYSVVRDISMYILHRSTLSIKGTLTKTLDEGVLVQNLNFTKALVEDNDEIFVTSIEGEKDDIVVNQPKINLINIDNFVKAKVFSSKKLGWILSHISDKSYINKIVEYLKETELKPTKLFFKCEFDELVANKEILEHLNEWLGSGLCIGKLKNKNEAFKKYSSDAKFKEYYAKWTNVYLISEIKPSLETVQDVYMVDFDVEKSKIISENFFSEINDIIPVNPDTFGPYVLSNRNIYDMLEDSKFSEDVSSSDGYYELLPRAYTDIDGFDRYNNAIVHPPLNYDISADELEKVGYLADIREDEKDGVSIFNNVKVSYYADWWHNNSWSIDNLVRLGQKLDSILNKNPVVGFILYEIYDYWKVTRGSDVSNKYLNMYTKEDKLKDIEIVDGLKFYKKDDSESEIDLIAEYSEDKKTINKVSKTINFGLVASQQSKQLDDVINIFSSYTFANTQKILESINNEHSKNFSSSFIVLYQKDKIKVADLVHSDNFDFTKTFISGLYEKIEGLTNHDLLEHCWSNYDKIREFSTLRRSFPLPEELERGDLFWSNVSWGFRHNLNKTTLVIDKPVFALLVSYNAGYTSAKELRFSNLYPLDIKPSLSLRDNVIANDDLSDVNLYPWVVYEKKHVLTQYESLISKEKSAALSARRTALKNLVDEFIKIMEKHSSSVWYFAYLKYVHGYLGQFKPFAFITGENWFYQYTGQLGGSSIYQAEFKQRLYWGIDNSQKSIYFANYIKPVKHWYHRGYWGHSYTYYDYHKGLTHHGRGYIGLNSAAEVQTAYSFNFTSYEDMSMISDSDKNSIAQIAGVGFDPDPGQHRDREYWYQKLVRFNNEVRRWSYRWSEVEKVWDNWSYNTKTSSTNFDDTYNNLSAYFSCSQPAVGEFDSIFDKTGYHTKFKGDNDSRLYGCLGITLQSLYKNTESLLLTRKGLECYWTDFKLKYIKDNYSANKLYIFKLATRTGSVVVDKAYALIQWNPKENKYLTQILIADHGAIVNKKINVTYPPELFINANIWQCINQKNYLYVWGKKIPIKAKLASPIANEPMDITIDTLQSGGLAVDKYKLFIKSPLEIIDTKIIVPKRKVNLGQNVVSYIDLEKLKLDISEREENKMLSIAAGDEKARILREKLQNAKDELAFQQVMGPFNLIGNVLMGAARVSRFIVPSPEPDNQFQRQSNIAAGVLGGAAMWQLGTGIGQHVHNMQTGLRDIEQTDKANSFTIAHEKNVLDSRHKHEELREKIRILELNSNYVDTADNDDDEEVKTSNKLLFGDEKLNFGFIHYRPREDGQLMEYIKNYYFRYGVEIFVNDYFLTYKNFANKDISIWQFDSISSINVTNIGISDKVKKIFMNGVRFTKTKYLFDDPKLTLDESYIIKAEFDEKRKIDETRRLLIAKGEIDAELSERVKIAKAHLDQANAEYQRLEEEKERLEARVAELEPLVAGGCTQEKLDELVSVKAELVREKASASALARTKMECEEKVKDLEGKLELEKRKVESANQQVVNAGKANYDLVKKAQQADTARDAALAEKDQALAAKATLEKEKNECNTALASVREELKTEKAELETKKKELADCKKEKENIVCDDRDEHAIFNDYVDKINALIDSALQGFLDCFYAFTNVNDRYTYAKKSGRYAYSDAIGPLSYYGSTSNTIYGTTLNLGYELYYQGSGLGPIMQLNRDLNWLYKANTYTRFPFTSCLRGGFLNESGYQGFWINTYAGDTNFFSSTVPHKMSYFIGQYFTFYYDYLRITKEFKRWNGKTDYLNKNNIKITPLNVWDLPNYSTEKDGGFIKEIYFNANNISWRTY